MIPFTRLYITVKNCLSCCWDIEPLLKILKRLQVACRSANIWLQIQFLSLSPYLAFNYQPNHIFTYTSHIFRKKGKDRMS